MQITTSIIETTGVPESLAADLFALEQEVFLNLYATCPADMPSFLQKYSARHLTIAVVHESNYLLGVRLFARLDETSMESLAMMVTASRRGLGYGHLLCSLSSAHLRWRKYRHITSFTHIDNPAASILHKFARIASKESKLGPMELQLLRRLEAIHSLPDGRLGDKRLIQGYYPMIDGSTGNANYWVHRL